MALHFPTASDYLQRTSGVFPSVSGDISITAWVQVVSAAVGGYQTFYSLNSADWDNSIWLGVSDGGTLEMYASNAVSPLVFFDRVGADVLPVGSWVGVAYRYDAASGTHRVYRRVSSGSIALVEGRDAGVASVPFAAAHPFTEERVGNDTASIGGVAVTHLRVWQRGLTPEQMLGELNRTTPGSTLGLVAALPLQIVDGLAWDLGPNAVGFVEIGTGTARIDGPLPPVNASPAGAVDLSPLPASVSIDETDVLESVRLDGYAPTCSSTAYGNCLWYKFTASAYDFLLAFSADVADPSLSTHLSPFASVWVGDDVDDLDQLTFAGSDLCENMFGTAAGHVWMHIPVEPGETYYIRVICQEFGAPTGHGLVIQAVAPPGASLPAGSVLIPHEHAPWRGTAMDAESGEVLRMLNIPACEFGVALSDGRWCLADGDEEDLFALSVGFFDAEFRRVATWVLPDGYSVTGITEDGTYFYVCYELMVSPTASKLTRFTAAGALVQTWTLPSNSAQLFALAVTRDSAKVFYAAKTIAASPIYAYNLNTSSALSDLVAGVAGRYVRQIVTMADGSLWALTGITTPSNLSSGVLRHYNSSGVQVGTINSPLDLSHLIARVSDAALWMWGYTSATQGTYAQFRLISLSSGVVTAQWQVRLLGVGVTPPGVQWGITGSCPLLVTSVAVPAHRDVVTLDLLEKGLVSVGLKTAALDTVAGDDAGDCECCVASKIDLINDALYKCGISKTIDALDEASQEATAGAFHVDKVIRETLRQHPWQFARKYADSGDAIATTDPMKLVGGSAAAAYNADWQYAYRYPSDCLFARRLVRVGTGKRYDESPAVWEIGRVWTGNEDGDYRVLLTDEPDAILEYTAYTECLEEHADDLFRDAAGWRLAAKLVPSLAQSQIKVMDALRAYELVLVRAANVGAQEQQQDKAGDVDWISGR